MNKHFSALALTVALAAHLTEALSSPSPPSSQNEDKVCEYILSPVLCSTDLHNANNVANMDWFANDCEANKAGYDPTTDCIADDCPTIYAPVWCGAEADHFPNGCKAAYFGYNEAKDCTCDESQDVQFLMGEAFGLENCEMISPNQSGQVSPIESEDIEMVYLCQLPEADLYTTLILKNGRNSNYPRPDSLTINMVGSGPSLGYAVDSLSFKNQCTDFEDALDFLNLYMIDTAGGHGNDNDEKNMCPDIFAPVWCGAESEWFTNGCEAELVGYEEAKDCTCDESLAIKDFMNSMFELNICDIIHPNQSDQVPPVKSEDIETWYHCQAPNSKTYVTLILKNGKNSVFPHPHSMEVNIASNNDPTVGSSIASLPFSNKCTDFVDAEDFLTHYGPF